MLPLVVYARYSLVVSFETFSFCAAFRLKKSWSWYFSASALWGQMHCTNIGDCRQDTNKWVHIEYADKYLGQIYKYRALRGAGPSTGGGREDD